MCVESSTDGNGALPERACVVKTVEQSVSMLAAQQAGSINPANYPLAHGLLEAGVVLPVGHLALLTSRWWGVSGVNLTVEFLDTSNAELKRRILSHMNAWAAHANVLFHQVSRQGQVRIARMPGEGYWSYLGTDILQIPWHRPTMNLEGFSNATPESEFKRVVRHETGHTLGFPHEHLRRDLVGRLDPEKTIAYFANSNGWSPQMTQAQVLTPLDEASLTASPADELSIMCYWVPGSCTRDGQPIPGGSDINENDYTLAGRVYRKSAWNGPTNAN